jgi:pyrimidine deaminase RibD-like protein
MNSIDDLVDQILADLLTDFLDKNLESDSLRKEYVGVSIPALKTKFCGDGAHSKIDFDLAFQQLEDNKLVKTGPLVPHQNTPGSQVFVVGLFSKREFVYLTEKGYKAAQKRRSKTRPHGNVKVAAVNVSNRDRNDDRKFALLAIEEARKSVSEPDGRPHPKVGAVVVKDGRVLSTAHRGERPENHAEYIALEKKLADETIAGATVYTTLEPCTTRNHPKIPCADRLIERKVARVVIGMLDPDDRIRGKGWQKLRNAGIVTDIFPHNLAVQIEEMNREFTRYCERQSKALKPSEPSTSDSATEVICKPNEYFQQRKRLADTAVLKKIWSKPYWRVWIGPSEFKKARFRNFEHCREFIISSALQGLFPYPRFSPDSIETDDEWIRGEDDYVGNTISIAEHWVLFRSAQFTQNRTIGEAVQFADRVHVLHILDIATAAFEFAARMAKQGVLSPKGIVNFELHGVAGKRLMWPKDVFFDNDEVSRDCWCQDESFSVLRESNSGEIEVQKRDLALKVALKMYSSFGWLDAPVDRLKEEQIKRFGAA